MERATGFSMGGFFINYLGYVANSPVRGIAELAEMWRSHGRCDGTPVEWDYPSGAVGLPKSGRAD